MFSDLLGLIFLGIPAIFISYYGVIAIYKLIIDEMGR